MRSFGDDLFTKLDFYSKFVLMGAINIRCINNYKNECMKNKIIKIGGEHWLMMKTPPQEIAMMLRNDFREIKDHILIYALKSDQAQLLLAKSQHRELVEAHDQIYVSGWCPAARAILEAKGWIKPKDDSPETVEKHHKAFTLWLYNLWHEPKKNFSNVEDFYAKRRFLLGYDPDNEKLRQMDGDDYQKLVDWLLGRVGFSPAEDEKMLLNSPVPHLSEAEQLELIASHNLKKIRLYGRHYFWVGEARLKMLELADEVTLALFFQFDRLKTDDEEAVFLTSGVDLLIWEYVKQHHISKKSIKIITLSGNYQLWKTAMVQNNMYEFCFEQRYGSIRNAEKAINALCTLEMFEDEYQKACQTMLEIQQA